MGELSIMQTVPTAPYDFELEEGLPLPHLLSYLYDTVAMNNQVLKKAIVDYVTNVATSDSSLDHADGCNCPCRYMVCLMKSDEVLVCLDDQSSTENSCEEDDVIVTKETELTVEKQKANHLKRKRIRTLTDEGDQSEETVSPSSSPQQERMKKHTTKRKVIKGVSYTAWAIASPVMLGLNLLRGSNDYDDEDDKYDDPLRPWNYKVNYQRPHKR